MQGWAGPLKKLGKKGQTGIQNRVGEGLEWKKKNAGGGKKPKTACTPWGPWGRKWDAKNSEKTRGAA